MTQKHACLLAALLSLASAITTPTCPTYNVQFENLGHHRYTPVVVLFHNSAVNGKFFKAGLPALSEIDPSGTLRESTKEFFDFGVSGAWYDFLTEADSLEGSFICGWYASNSQVLLGDDQDAIDEYIISNSLLPGGSLNFTVTPTNKDACSCANMGVTMFWGGMQTNDGIAFAELPIIGKSTTKINMEMYDTGIYANDENPFLFRGVVKNGPNSPVTVPALDPGSPTPTINGVVLPHPGQFGNHVIRNSQNQEEWVSNGFNRKSIIKATVSTTSSDQDLGFLLWFLGIL